MAKEVGLPVAHPLDGARAKAERAIEQITELHNEIIAFFKLNPYRLVSEPDPEAGTGLGSAIIRGFIEKEPPIRFCVLIGEIVHHLRSVLDYIVCELVIANGRSVNRNTGFPVCVTENEYKTNGVSKVERASAEAQALIESLQPYHGRKNPNTSALYRLHHLDRIDKHRALNLIGCAVVLGTLWVDRSWYDPMADGTLPRRSLRIRAPRFATSKGRGVIPFQNGAELFRLTADGDVKMQQEMSFNIAFNEPGIIQGQPVIPALDELATFTTRTFDAFLLRFFPEGVEGVDHAAPPPAP